MNWLWLVPVAWLVFDLLLLAPDPPAPDQLTPTFVVELPDTGRVQTPAILAP